MGILLMKTSHQKKQMENRYMRMKMPRTMEKFMLSAVEIDRFSEKTVELLQQAGVTQKDILRFRLSIENVM